MKNTNRTKTKLRAAREALGLSQERAAVEAQISVSWLRQLERDPYLLTPRVSAKLLPVLGLSQQEVGT